MQEEVHFKENVTYLSIAMSSTVYFSSFYITNIFTIEYIIRMLHAFHFLAVQGLVHYITRTLSGVVRIFFTEAKFMTY